MENPKDKAKEIIESFYKFMPFKDTKLTSCDENHELIVKMEKLSAKQCALITVDELIADRLNSNILYPSYWEQVKIEIQNYND